MDEGFQSKMREIFRECKGCKFTSGHVKSYERSKVKAQIEYANEAFPKSAHIVDVVRCSATFDGIEDLKNGLNHFKRIIVKSNGIFEVMRMKNGFAQKPKSSGVTLGGQKKDEHSDSKKKKKESVLLSDTFHLEIPSGYQDVKFNVIYTEITEGEGNKESIVGEVQFLLRSIARWKMKGHKMYEISRQAPFINGCYDQLCVNDFDFQLKLSGFNHNSLSKLMLYFPLKFRESKYILNEKDADGDNFVSKIAFNSKVKYNCLKELLGDGDLIPTDVVQEQLLEKNQNGDYPLMFALWKQSSIEAIHLFIPSFLANPTEFWHCVNKFDMPLLDYALRNTLIDVSSSLKLLKENIDESKWNEFIVTQETWVCDFNIHIHSYKKKKLLLTMSVVFIAKRIHFFFFTTSSFDYVAIDLKKKKKKGRVYIAALGIYKLKTESGRAP
ncbi:hypothetical protein RFI_18122 [Reticulomyxa filosa]|uniref:Uncharacterized protein n=1 Tax=Reticulomyxa filosa TaxID=46433 RepID=X6MZ66_RETFI|nr:hypothetical protein RFI_18122 [Reticulomyxa filosa]|eukprot:ETO19116.1 hypothetical protein RFI_18122 [Reticulomyxa filosa]